MNMETAGQKPVGTEPLPPPLPDEMGQIEEQGRRYAQNPVAALLKAPLWCALKIGEGNALARPSFSLMAWGLAFHVLYGLAMGLFGGWETALVAASKAPLIVLCAVLLCIPSLYVFGCVGGMPLTLAQAFALASSAVAMTGLMLIGLAPVAWLFAVSTNSLPFVVILNLVAWLIAMGFAWRFFNQLRVCGSLGKTVGLKWWLFVYIIVSLQMATTMRPLLVAPDSGKYEPGKKFFLTHFAESLGGKPGAPASETRGVRPRHGRNK